MKFKVPNILSYTRSHCSKEPENPLLWPPGFYNSNPVMIIQQPKIMTFPRHSITKLSSHTGETKLNYSAKRENVVK